MPPKALHLPESPVIQDGEKKRQKHVAFLSQWRNARIAAGTQRVRQASPRRDETRNIMTMDVGIEWVRGTVLGDALSEDMHAALLRPSCSGHSAEIYKSTIVGEVVSIDARRVVVKFCIEGEEEERELYLDDLNLADEKLEAGGRLEGTTVVRRLRAPGDMSIERGKEFAREMMDLAKGLKRSPSPVVTPEAQAAAEAEPEK